MNVEWLDPGPGQAPCTLDDLAAVGVLYEHLIVDPVAYQPPLDRLKAARGYVEQDVIELHPQTPKLDEICAKFIDEHLHTDDEVRYVLEGEGIFDIRSSDDRWMRVTVTEGDLLVVPANLHHRFLLTERKHIRCVRLFKDSAGWVPHYRHQASVAAPA
ncbi:MAG: cupin domain-containing protein [Myxococcales bacterium]|nr:cupin domain-containing protein [Myxococcales bacterium]